MPCSGPRAGELRANGCDSRHGKHVRYWSPNQWSPEVAAPIAPASERARPARRRSAAARSRDHHVEARPSCPAEQGNVELRDLAHGILPAALTSGGLRAGVDTLLP